MKNKEVIAIIMAVVLVILMFGSQNGILSYGLSGAVSEVVQQWLGGVSDESPSAESIDMILRKIAHFSEYLILAAVLFAGIGNRIKAFAAALPISWLICLLIAISDETIQSLYFLKRNSSLFDVVLDMLGATVGLLAVGLFATMSKWFEIRDK